MPADTDATILIIDYAAENPQVPGDLLRQACDTCYNKAAADVWSREILIYWRSWIHLQTLANVLMPLSMAAKSLS